METVKTQYGDLPATGLIDRYADGSVRAAWVNAPFSLETAVGSLVPQYTIDDSRRMTKPPVTFYPNGQVRSVPLEKRAMLATPAGPLPAELVTFHENGAVARVFPLNGKLSGYWTEADEAGIAEILHLETAAGPLAAKLVAVAFDPDGHLRSLTLWPGEETTVQTPVGALAVRFGVSFYPTGAVRSVEPARPVAVETPVGSIVAYDSDAVGISGDANSLCFDPAGVVTRIATVRTSLRVRLADGARAEFAPLVRESICGDGDREMTPLVLEFATAVVTARYGTGEPVATLPRAGAVFTPCPFVSVFAVPFAPKQCSM